MEALPLSPERSRELADLRRRAYGPDADILGDPLAQRRLDELEGLARRAAPAPGAPPASSPDPAAPTASLASPLAAEQATPTQNSADPEAPAAASAPQGLPESAGADERPTRRGPVTRLMDRTPRWAPIAAAGVVGLVLGLAVPASLAERPDAELAVASSPGRFVDPAWIEGLVDWLSIEGDLVSHEPFRGIQVRSGVSSAGSTCLLVTWSTEWADGRCAPDGLDPIVDFPIYADGPNPFGDETPVGSVIRFELHGDVVSVFVKKGEAPEA